MIRQMSARRAGVMKRSRRKESLVSAEKSKSQSTPESEDRKRAENEKAQHQMEELRSERDHGYGSEYIGNEYKDVKIEDEETKKDEAA